MSGITYIEEKDGRISNIFVTKDANINLGKQYKIVPNNFKGNIADKLDYFDKNWTRISNQELVKQGKIIDNRGTWYNKKTREKKEVKDYDIAVDTNIWTKEKPIENEPYQLWDGKKWVIDTEQKKQMEAQKELEEIQNSLTEKERQIEKLEAEQLKIFKNIYLKIDIEENDAKLRALQTEIEALKPQTASLEKEITLKKSILS